MKKFKIALILALVLTIGLSAGVYADSLARQIKAVQNGAIKVEVNGTNLDLTDSTGSLAPIIYNGHSYVPAKALAESLGATVKWDAKTSTVIVSGGTVVDGSLPIEDNSETPATTPAPVKTTPPTPSPTTSPNISTGNPKIVYSSSTGKEAIIQDYKSLAGKILKAYGSALKTGDTATLDSLITSLGIKDQAFSAKSADESISKARDTYSQVILDKMSTQINNAVDNDDLDTSGTASYASTLDIKFMASFSSGVGPLGKQITFSFVKDFDSMSLKLTIIYM